jgi:hypothetical protein
MSAIAAPDQTCAGFGDAPLPDTVAGLPLSLGDLVRRLAPLLA